MRYELTDYEWVAIKPFLPNKPRGVPRVNDRRVPTPETASASTTRYGNCRRRKVASATGESGKSEGCCNLGSLILVFPRWFEFSCAHKNLHGWRKLGRAPIRNKARSAGLLNDSVAGLLPSIIL